MTESDRLYRESVLERHAAQLDAMYQQHKLQLSNIMKQQNAQLESMKRQHKIELEVIEVCKSFESPPA
jgi:hypothetical protein